MPGSHPVALKNVPGVIDEVGEWIIPRFLLSGFKPMFYVETMHA